MKTNDIVTTVLLNGAEVIGRYVKTTDDTVTIYRPRLVSPQEQGLAFVPGITMTGIEPEGDFDFPKRSVLFVIKANEQIANSWQSVTSGIITNEKGLIT